MTKKQGNLSIHSENIFPIIKKWLYSDHDIFVRELVSNASDAITKVQRLSSLGEADLGEQNDFAIRIQLDPEKKTLSFSDNGIGMTGEEVEKYINQIAFSGAEDFLEKYKDMSDDEQIIGHFGLGFYSSFMVAKEVDIFTKSHLADAQAVHWVCDGGTTYSLEETTKEDRGTRIVLHLGDDGEDFLQEAKVRSTLNKYCSFMPYPIYFEVVGKEEEKEEEAPLNTTNPLYTRRPNEVTEEEYKDFYQRTFNDFKDPLFWIHLNMDYPFNLKGILYFPKINTEFESIEGKIKLYNNQVFVADNIKEVIPEFLLLLKGVIDCPDLPLNVSRSALQNDGFVKKISDYITKKVADKLTGLFNTERENYERYWKDIQPFVKYGALRDEKFYDKVEPAILYQLTNEKFLTLSEYKAAYEEKAKDTLFYATNVDQQGQYIHLLQDHGIEAAILPHPIDQAFVGLVEGKQENFSFVRVDGDLSSHLKDEEEVEVATQEKLETFYRDLLNKEDFKVKVERLKSDEVAGMILINEQSRRMQDMMKMYQMNGMDLPTDETFVLNEKNNLVQKLLHLEDTDKKKLLGEHLYDLARMSNAPLKAKDLKAFIERSQKIMTQL